ncbi:hypothetical protein C7974DRAFT_286996, partial [Boeremia exigua]|uniref:uncharacterized protein n=1 Tax=Boeremia exigua TaxID=749465 RepID=UPI001E8DFCC0
PTVLRPLTLPALLDRLLAPPASPATVVVCADRASFVAALARALQPQGTRPGRGLQQRLAPTVHTLSVARHVGLAFCPSVQALLAFLAAYGRPRQAHGQHGAESGGGAALVLVNLLALHKPTPSFSAQGLSRAFAAAVDAAARTGAALQLVECEDWQQAGELDPAVLDPAVLPPADDAAMSDGDPDDRMHDPWDQDVSILNVSARRFGSAAGERSWAGRTVTAERIAARWFRFQHL